MNHQQIHTLNVVKLAKIFILSAVLIIEKQMIRECMLKWIFGALILRCCYTWRMPNAVLTGLIKNVGCITQTQSDLKMFHIKDLELKLAIVGFLLAMIIW